MLLVNYLKGIEMANRTGFSKAWNWRSKNSARNSKAGLKKEHSRLNRREGKRHLDDAPNHKLNERDVI